MNGLYFYFSCLPLINIVFNQAAFLDSVVPRNGLKELILTGRIPQKCKIFFRME